MKRGLTNINRCETALSVRRAVMMGVPRAVSMRVGSCVAQRVLRRVLGTTPHPLR